jgi:hypothetical protein
VRRLFHAHPGISLQQESDLKYLLKTDTAELKQYFFGETDITVESSFVSSIYNTLTNTNVVQADSNFKDQGTFLTVIAPADVNVYTDIVKQSGSNEKVDPNFMQALILQGASKVSVMNGQLDTVHGHKLYQYRNIPFYGRLNIIDSDGNAERFL